MYVAKYVQLKIKQLGFSHIQGEEANLPILPKLANFPAICLIIQNCLICLTNPIKIKDPLIVI